MTTDPNNGGGAGTGPGGGAGTGPKKPPPPAGPKKDSYADAQIFAEADRIHADFSLPAAPELKF